MTMSDAEKGGGFISKVIGDKKRWRVAIAS